jgi:MYXO-CTERM domain-containing protein
LFAQVAEAQEPCANDAQCASVTDGKKCETAVDMSVVGCGCLADSDCASPLICDKTTDPNFFFCNDAPCTSNTTCANSPYGKVCDTAMSHLCGCAMDSDCPTGRVCDMNALFCLPAPCVVGMNAGCATQNSGHVCNDFMGQQTYCGCATDADCPTGLACDNRGDVKQCVVKCTADVACSGQFAAGPKCDTTTGFCGCAADTDCQGANEKCDMTTHLCAVPPCTSDADCAMSTQGSKCDLTAMPAACGCVTDADCAANAGTKCDAMSKTCQTPPCMSNADCANSQDGHVCDTMGGLCGCMTDADCPAGSACDMNFLFCMAATTDGGPADGGGPTDAGPASDDGVPDASGGLDLVQPRDMPTGGHVDVPVGGGHHDMGNPVTPPVKGGGCSVATAGASDSTAITLSLFALLGLFAAFRRRR